MKGAVKLFELKGKGNQPNIKVIIIWIHNKDIYFRNLEE